MNSWHNPGPPLGCALERVQEKKQLLPAAMPCRPCPAVQHNPALRHGLLQGSTQGSHDAHATAASLMAMARLCGCPGAKAENSSAS